MRVVTANSRETFLWFPLKAFGILSIHEFSIFRTKPFWKTAPSAKRSKNPKYAKTPIGVLAGTVNIIRTLENNVKYFLLLPLLYLYAPVQAGSQATVGDIQVSVIEIESRSGDLPKDIVLNIIPLGDGKGRSEITADGQIISVEPVYPQQTQAKIYRFEDTVTHDVMTITHMNRWFVVDNRIAFELIYYQDDLNLALAYELSTIEYQLRTPGAGSRLHLADLSSNLMDAYPNMILFSEIISDLHGHAFYAKVIDALRQLDGEFCPNPMYGQLEDPTHNKILQAVILLNSMDETAATFNILWIHDALANHPCLD